ncbi:MAG TPA: copper resistance protein CopC [Candidatus Methylomirabilis sp.]|nr:copper resistance protein CopC [Candidatus Methylomirabilis sp.]
MRPRSALGKVSVLLMVALVSWPCAAWAHAFPDHSNPRVGHTVDAPRSVRVWFDGDIEPVFSTIRVEDADKRQVDSGDGRVDPKDSTLLEVSVPQLPSGGYRVFWSVVARDGHRTEGSFPFQVK